MPTAPDAIIPTGFPSTPAIPQAVMALAAGSSPTAPERVVSQSPQSSGTRASVEIGSGNAKILFTAVAGGTAGNLLTVFISDPGVVLNNLPITISQSGSLVRPGRTFININRATDSSGNYISTAAQIISAINASPAVTALTASLGVGSNGSSLMSGGEADLVGGSGSSTPTAPTAVTGSGIPSAPTAPAAVTGSGVPSGPTAPAAVTGSGVPAAPTAPAAVNGSGVPSTPTAPAAVRGSGVPATPTAPAAVQA